MNDPVQKVTGESTKTVIWMVAGAAAVAVFVAPLLQRYLPISATLALIIAGAALAYFGKGAIKSAGQGAAFVGISSYAMSLIAPIFGGLAGRLGVPTAAKKPSQSGPLGVI